MHHHLPRVEATTLVNLAISWFLFGGGTSFTLGKFAAFHHKFEISEVASANTGLLVNFERRDPARSWLYPSLTIIVNLGRRPLKPATGSVWFSSS